MKKNLLIYSSVILVALVLISGTLYNTGSPGAKTGSPLDGGNTCIQCHTGSEVTEVENWISTTIPETGWKLAETYTITVTATNANASRIGFELTAESETEKVGKFKVTDSQRSKYTNNQKAITHTTAGHVPTDGMNQWTFDWTAPDYNSGDITFYAAFNAANGNGETSGDTISTSTIVYSQHDATDVKTLDELSLKIYPNPAVAMAFINSPSAIEEINIVTLNGKNLTSIKGNLAKTDKIDVSGLNAGLYLFKVRTTEGELVQKIQVK